ncbi:MAG: TPM domain-containing protein [Pirellulales bacterium]
MTFSTRRDYPRVFEFFIVLICCLCLHIGTRSASAQGITLDKPGDREFFRDLAGMLSADDKKHIQEVCDKLLTDTATPILVVTIDSMAAHGGAGLRIETFATLLFDQWQIGHAKINGQDWNTGILLLISRDDRKARIELGGGWGRREDALCTQIMNEQIVPNFKSGAFSRGIVAGVDALDKMARKLELPKAVKPPLTNKQVLVGFVFAGLAIFTMVSLIRRGSGGWAWLFWGVIFSLIGSILYEMSHNRGGSSGSGGFSGGSFGGGSSGGGGATGSW